MISRLLLEVAVCVEDNNKVTGLMFFNTRLHTFGNHITIVPFPTPEFESGLANACFRGMDRIMPDRDVE